jgi:hypothetical protein
MDIRQYKGTDWDAICAWHKASGFDYPMPDLRSPLVCLLGVAEQDGVPVAASGVKLIGECFYWQDESAPPSVKARAMVKLHKDLERDASRMGLDQVVAYLPPEIDQAFSTRLIKFGWRPSTWKAYAKNIV